MPGGRANASSYIGTRAGGQAQRHKRRLATIELLQHDEFVVVVIDETGFFDIHHAAAIVQPQWCLVTGGF